MQYENFYKIVSNDLMIVDSIIRKQLKSSIPLIEQISEYIVKSGGKRLRPILVLLLGKALGYKNKNLYLLATSIEFLHTSTLLHDDVVDNSHLRRGKSTANAIWGNASSILVGDFLYARSLEMIVKLESISVMRILSYATRIIAEGEVLQLSNIRNANICEKTYMKIIHHKTAMLFEAATHSTADLCSATKTQKYALRKFGSFFGITFQLIDDLLDYFGKKNLGKTLVNDLAEGKPTLPLIITIKRGTISQVDLIKKTLNKPDFKKFKRHDIKKILYAIESSGALAYTEKLAKKYAENAISNLRYLPQNQYKSALIELTEFTLNRSS